MKFDNLVLAALGAGALSVADAKVGRANRSLYHDSGGKGKSSPYIPPVSKPTPVPPPPTSSPSAEPTSGRCIGERPSWVLSVSR